MLTEPSTFLAEREGLRLRVRGLGCRAYVEMKKELWLLVKGSLRNSYIKHVQLSGGFGLEFFVVFWDVPRLLA